MLTEQQNPKTHNLDQLPTEQILRLMNAEDRLVNDVIADAIPQISAAIDAIAAQLQRGGRLFYVGAGTSGRLGVLDAAECVPTFNTPPELVQAIIAGGDAALVHAIEGAEDDADAGRAALVSRVLSANDAVVGIAASGRTPYVLGAMAYASEVGAVRVGISCNVPAKLLDAAQYPIGLPVGAEVLTGSTRLKAGTAQKLVLNMISTASMVRLGKVYGNLMVDVKVTNAKLKDRAERIVAQVTGVSTPEAALLLQQTDYNVKQAIVMSLLGVDAASAAAKLDAARGVLRHVISG